MTNKWQKYTAIGVIALVFILIVTRLIANRVSWEEEDHAILTSTCLDDLGGYAVRFPLLSED